MMITDASHPMNNGLWVGSVPSLAGSLFFLPREPARARIGTNEEIPAQQNDYSQGEVVEGVIGIKPGEC